MRRLFGLWVVCGLLSCTESSDSPTPPPADTADLLVDSLGDPAPFASPDQLQAFQRGKDLAHHRFAPSQGLGPHFNVTFCAACHERPTTGGSAPRYRDFLLSARADTANRTFAFTHIAGILPQFLLSSARFPTDPTTNTLATRNPIPFFGVGLLAEIPDAEILSREDPDDDDRDGISGRANTDDQGRLARFGRKAQAASVEPFIRGPLFNHLGITSDPLPPQRRDALPTRLARAQDPTNLLELLSPAHAQAAASDDPSFDFDPVPDPELPEQDLFDLVSFTLSLGAPRPDPNPSPSALAGRARFAAIGCAACHTPALQGPRGLVPAFSDLLLHDMGPELADGILQGQATGSEFRTQPLWGLAPTGPYLHDGRADTVHQAITLHAGEARAARDRYLDLSPDHQQTVLDFLDSLGGASQRAPGLLPPDDPGPPSSGFGALHANLTSDQQQLALRGRLRFDRDQPLSEGLGPLFNGDSCRACHFEPVLGGAGPLGLNVTRHGILDANNESTLPPLGSVLPRHHTRRNQRARDGTLTDRSVFETRQTPALFGLGLLERVPEATIRALADPLDLDGDGVSGRLHELPDGRLGRFGWKAQIPSLAEFTRDALSTELGVTVPPQTGRTFGDLTDTDDAADPEATPAELDALTAFVAALAAPPRVRLDVAAEDRGELQFDQLGCATCHVQELRLDDGTPIHPYTDLLLHDVRARSAVGIPDGDAAPTEFRTPPLWGVSRTPPFLHDGSAETLHEAILSHGGEARSAAAHYATLDPAQQDDVLAFLRSLGGGDPATLRPTQPTTSAPPSGNTIQFVDVTAAAGIDLEHYAGPTTTSSDGLIGQAWGDYDRDGHLDLYLSAAANPNRLYRNRGDGTFETSPHDGDLSIALHTGGAVFVDYDNDGYQDLYVLAWGPNHLFHNDAGQGFTDVSAASGLADPGQGTHAAWGDYDLDGDLDVYVVNWFNPDLLTSPDTTTDRLYRNEGDGTFTDVTSLLGAPVTGQGFSASWFDADGDGDPDLYVVNDKGLPGPDRTPLNRNAFFRNDGPGPAGHRFTERAIDAGTDLRIFGMGLAIGDFDNDLDLDLATSDNPPFAWLLRNDGPTFTDVSVPSGIQTPRLVGWGLAFLDVDRDGWLDLYHAAESAPGNRLHRNQRDGTFLDISAGSRTDLLDPSWGVAVADYDRDGRVDLLVGSAHSPFHLLRNISSDGNHWLGVRLTGGGAVNRDAVGARVFVTRSDGLVLLQEVLCGTGLGAGHDLALHFGLADQDVTQVRVLWPDGTETTLNNPPRDSYLDLHR